VGCVAIQHRGVAVGDLTRVVQHNNLGKEVLGTRWRAVLGVTSDVTTTQFLNGNVLDVETNVVTGHSFSEGFVVHFDRLDFSGQVSRGKGDNHTRLEDTSFDTADRDGTNTTNLVDILKQATNN